MRKVIVDTSVLFPFSVMDLFLALAEDRAHLVLWTDELLDEWERVTSGTTPSCCVRDDPPPTAVPRLYGHAEGTASDWSWATPIR